MRSHYGIVCRRCVRGESVPASAPGGLDHPILSARIRLFPLAVVLCFVGGCGGSDIETAPVSGVVTLDGAPIADILVNFQPVAGATMDATASPGSYGLTDPDGRYTLEWADGDGAVVREHVVTAIYKDPNKAKPKDFVDESGKEIPHTFKLPAEARDGSLRFTVPAGGTDEANFAFVSSTRK